MGVKYRVYVYCRYCCGEDPDGCFDGGSEQLGNDDFNTYEEADLAGTLSVRDYDHLDYEIIEIEDD